MAGEAGRSGPKGRIIYYFSLLGFFAIFSTTISKNPVLPLYAKTLGADDALIGLIAALSPFAGVVFSFPIGVASDKIGRGRLLKLAGLIFLLAPPLYLLVSNPWFLIPIRFFHGAATAILGPVVSAILAEKYAQTKGEKIGIYSSATLIGRTIAPLAGGAVIAHYAFFGLNSYQSVYLLAAAAAVPVFALTLLHKDDYGRVKGAVGFSDFKESLRAYFSDRRLTATALVDLSTYFSYGAMETYLPLFLQAKGFSAYETGMIFAVQIFTVAATKPIMGKAADRVDKRKQIALGMAALGLCMAAVPYAADMAGFLIISVVAGLAISTSTIATTTYTADVARQKELGASMGALSGIMDIGQTGGPLITGMIVASGSYASGFAASAVLAAACTAYFLHASYGRVDG
jgi:MFS family permease